MINKVTSVSDIANISIAHVKAFTRAELLKRLTAWHTLNAAQ